MKNIIATTAIQTMKKMTATLALGLATFALAGTAVAGDRNHKNEPRGHGGASDGYSKHPVTRPFFSKSHVEVTLNLTDFPTITWTAVVKGTATHLGAYTAQAEGVVLVDFCEDPEGNPFPCFFTPVGAGVLTAANGDTLSNTFANPGNGPEGGVMTFTGGTGRFENASGEAVQAQYNVVEVDNGDGTLTLAYDDVFIGEIKY